MTSHAPTADSQAAPSPNAGASGRLVKSVALPSEHGGWSFLFEPIALGLLVAPSFGGLALGIAVVGAFLLHQPLKTAVKDRLAGRRAYRTIWAERFAAAYGAIALAGIAFVVWAHGPNVLALPLAAAPFAAAQLVWDARNKSRALGAEICGAIALGAVGAGIAKIAGWPLAAAAALWLALVARSVPSVLYVRARLKLERKKAFAWTPVVVAHLAALVAVAVASRSGLLPGAAAGATALLFSRAIWGLSDVRSGHTAAAVGAQEVIAGLLFVAFVASGY
jgi:hypothetical protein